MLGNNYYSHKWACYYVTPYNNYEETTVFLPLIGLWIIIHVADQGSSFNSYKVAYEI